VTDATQFRIIFDALVKERGGLAAFSLADAAIARQVARLLITADDDEDATAAARTAQAIGRLMALLPPKREEPAPDLNKLTDGELALFERLMMRACGVAPPSKFKRPKRSVRD
jgi:hypothetical protein